MDLPNLMEEKIFKTDTGVEIDLIVTTPDEIKAVILFYPCIGGTSRSYSLPRMDLARMGFMVIEYHPPRHGRSTGQMSMPNALSNLYETIVKLNCTTHPMIVIGHSAGCNALLQMHPIVFNIKKYILIQPVLDFRESMLYMYKKNTDNEFIEAITKWVNNTNELKKLLLNNEWLDLKKWHTGDYRKKLNSISKPDCLMLGDFLQDFYIPGYFTKRNLASINKPLDIYITRKDNWYPVESIVEQVFVSGAKLSVIEQSNNHYFTGCWKLIWSRILDTLEKNLTTIADV